MTVPDLGLEPMLAAVAEELPEGPTWTYEPKWDGFRTLVRRSGDRIEMVSRGGRDLNRYFPELVEAFSHLGGEQWLIDGEVILALDHGLDFDALQQRIHPAASRIKMLAETTPASYVAFDALAVGDESLVASPLEERRQRLEQVLQDPPERIYLTPRTADPELARSWFWSYEGAGLDGVIGKRRGEHYLPGKRAWVKLKHRRTADCVLIGYRLSNDGSGVGSLLLGLHDEGGVLHYVGHTSSFDAATRRALLKELQPMRIEPTAEEMGRAPGALSRWSQGKTQDWVGVRPERVVEVSYEKLQAGQRFRHAARFLRWREDKTPAECSFEQISLPAAFDLGAIISSTR
ncbi:MAG TPA: ATP-dependent DNA ligase [Candidatus Dormibacteraeota bacterium]|jgi:ATP-dependent DNA ligase|nr:ATP-dependent DNA ligase [Candidatus Dormibacteraeota bacterium]